MSLTRFQDQTFLNYKGTNFVWEPAWESFRPIDAVRWNGHAFVVDDVRYTQDLLDPQYGYGTAKMKQVCELLTESYGPRIASARTVHTPELGDTVWMVDRFVALTPCCPRDKASWKRMCRGRYRTPREAPRSKGTRRNRPNLSHKSTQ